MIDYTSPAWFGKVLKARRFELAKTKYEMELKLGSEKSLVHKIETLGVIPEEYVEKISRVYQIPKPLIEFVYLTYAKPIGKDRFRYFQILRKEKQNERDRANQRTNEKA